MSVRLGQTVSSAHEWSVSLLSGLTLSASLIPLGLSGSSSTKLPPLNNNYCIANPPPKKTIIYCLLNHCHCHALQSITCISFLVNEEINHIDLSFLTQTQNYKDFTM